MTPDELEEIKLALSRQVGRPLSDREIGELVGRSWRQVQRYRHGQVAVPEAVARLLRIAARDGIEAVRTARV